MCLSGTGKNARVEGYRIGGKTGTSEDGVNTNKYVTSFIGVAPIEDPEVVMLVTLYNPTGEGGHQGGGVAAPIGSQVLGEVLPYLEIQKQGIEDSRVNVTMPDVRGKSIKEAKSILKETGLNVRLQTEAEEINEEETIVIEQLPKPGIQILSETEVDIYYK